MTDLSRPCIRGALFLLAVGAASFALVMANARTAPEQLTQKPKAETNATPADPPEKPALQAARGRGQRAKDIRLLSQHFNEPGKDFSPWMFVPKENIKELSTSE